MQYYAGWDPNHAAQDFKVTYGGDVNRLLAARGLPSGQPSNPGSTPSSGGSFYGQSLTATGDSLNNVFYAGSLPVIDGSPHCRIKIFSTVSRWQKLLL